MKKDEKKLSSRIFGCKDKPFYENTAIYTVKTLPYLRMGEFLLFNNKRMNLLQTEFLCNSGRNSVFVY